MREFFRGWKRKVGLTTLLVALLLMVGWLTCLGRWELEKNGVSVLLWPGVSSSDVYSLDCGNTTWISFNESLIWTCRLKRDSRDATFLNWNIDRPYGPSSYFEFRQPRWKWEWCGLGIGYFEELAYVVDEGQYDVVPNPFWMFPYWSIVLPLTVLSAWLLISKPPSNKPQPSPEQ